MELKDLIKPENLVYDKSKVQKDVYMHYCPGCSHGVVHKILSELIEELNIQDKSIGIAPVGCAVFAYNYIDVDWQEAAHGRAPAGRRRPLGSQARPQVAAGPASRRLFSGHRHRMV